MKQPNKPTTPGTLFYLRKVFSTIFIIYSFNIVDKVFTKINIDTCINKNILLSIINPIDPS